MKENNQTKLRRINNVATQTSSTGSDPDNCMPKAEYERLCKEGKLTKSVYVCGEGICFPPVHVYEYSGSGSGSGEQETLCPICHIFHKPGEPCCGSADNPFENSGEESGEKEPTPGGGGTTSGGDGKYNPGGTADYHVKLTGTRTNLSSYTLNLLRNIKGFSGTIHITSTARTPEQQARAMLNNIKKNGVASQKKLYAPPGDCVVDVYDPTKSDEENYQNMLAENYRQGPTKVSKHCADLSKLNVLDISRRILTEAQISTIITYLESLGARCIDERDNHCVHIEIPQKAK